MKILIAVFTYWPDVNGVQKVTQYQAEYLARFGHQVRVVTGYSENSAADELHNGVWIHRIHAFTDRMLHFGNKKEYQRLLRQASQEEDVILTVFPQSWCTDWALPLIRQLSCATVMMVHGIHDFRWSTFHDKSLYGLVRKLWGDVRWRLFFARNWENLRSYDAIVHLHEEDFAAQYFRKNGILSEHILYNAVEDVFFSGSGPEKENQIINIGTCSPNKNQIACLEAFYRANLPNWKLLLICPSHNAYSQRLLSRQKELEARYGHREAALRIGLSRAETVAAIRRSKIYLLTSISEVFPVSLLEGMAAGCAWVSTNVGVNRFLPGGMICDTTQQMAGALEKLAQQDAWAALGKEGQAFAARHCRQETQAKRLEAVLRQAVERRRAQERLSATEPFAPL